MFSKREPVDKKRPDVATRTSFNVSSAFDSTLGFAFFGALSFAVLFSFFAYVATRQLAREACEAGLVSLNPSCSTFAEFLGDGSGDSRGRYFSLDAPEVQEAAQNAVESYLSSVDSDARFSDETKERYRSELTGARERFHADEFSANRRELRQADAEVSHEASETFLALADGEDADDALNLALDFLSEIDEIETDAQVFLPEQALPERERFDDFSANAVFAVEEQIGPTTETRELAAKEALGDAFCVWGLAQSFFAFGAIYFSNARVDFKSLFLSRGSRILTPTRLSSRVLTSFLSPRRARTLDDLASVRLLR